MCMFRTHSVNITLNIAGYFSEMKTHVNPENSHKKRKVHSSFVLRYRLYDALLYIERSMTLYTVSSIFRMTDENQNRL